MLASGRLQERGIIANAGDNINARNIAWFRFQSDTGLQAAYTDPINPLFNAISSQPLYSFASGYTHVFSGRLVNYFNPAFSWYQSLFGPADLEKTLAAFPIVLQGSGANAPFTTLGGLDNTWVQGRRATRFFINDNLAWTVGSHELRFGTNSRIFRLNDYDFGAGTVPLVTYATLPQFIHGVASTASATYPLANSQPYNFLNLDFYAQDTWKVTRQLTWTFGLRSTYNSNPVNPHKALARLDRFFDEFREVFGWVRPRGGMTAFPWLLSGENARGFCEEAARGDVLLAPGDCFGMPAHFRLGFGASGERFPEALERLTDVVKRFPLQARAAADVAP